MHGSLKDSSSTKEWVKKKEVDDAAEVGEEQVCRHCVSTLSSTPHDATTHKDQGARDRCKISGMRGHAHGTGRSPQRQRLVV